MQPKPFKMPLLPESAVILSTIHKNLDIEVRDDAPSNIREGYKTHHMSKTNEEYMKTSGNLHLLHMFPLVGDLSAPELRIKTNDNSRQLLVTVNYMVKRGLISFVGTGLNRSPKAGQKVRLYRREVVFSLDMILRAYPDLSKEKADELYRIECEQAAKREE